MQTFLPYPGFKKSAYTLDFKRLGKQRLECHQILATLATVEYYKSIYSYDPKLLASKRKTIPWANHPAVKMWEGFTDALKEYTNAIILEWVDRKGKNNYPLHDLPRDEQGNLTITYPAWLGDDRLHASHRSNLLRKAYVFYMQYDWLEPPTLPYWWPK